MSEGVCDGGVDDGFMKSFLTSTFGLAAGVVGVEGPDVDDELVPVDVDGVGCNDDGFVVTDDLPLTGFPTVAGTLPNDLTPSDLAPAAAGAAADVAAEGGDAIEADVSSIDPKPNETDEPDRKAEQLYSVT